MWEAGHLWTRRRFLVGASAIGAYQILAPQVALAFNPDLPMPEVPGWDNAGHGVRSRIDGYAKVTGAKLYARDVRARDMQGWPDETHHALLLFAPTATHVFEGIDLSMLGDDFQPDRIVMAEDLQKAGIAATGFFESNLFCAKGAAPDYLGQPVAMLIYADLGRFSNARLALTGEAKVMKFGEERPARSTDPYGSNRFTRVEGESRKGPDVYSPVQHGWIRTMRYQKSYTPVWSEPAASGDAAAQSSLHGEEIRKDLTEGKAGKLYRQKFETQSLDPMFMEPESGLAWYEAGSGRLSLVLGVQSPLGTMQGISDMAASAADGFKIAEIDAHFTFIGGGFGCKDHSMVPLYISVAGLFGDGHPVRLALNRFEQFQFGLKRHPFTMDAMLGVDEETGKFNAFTCDLVGDGGGLANFSSSVGDNAASAANSIYYMPRSDVTVVVEQSINVNAGSYRGYGTYQSMSAMEVMVDEVARDLGKDPIALRRVNLLGTGDLNLTGNALTGAVRTGEILDRLEQSALWTGRQADKVAYEAANPGYAYGVGVSCVSKNFGAGADATMATVELGPDGNIKVYCDAIEMGTGISTAAAVRMSEHLGRNADTIEMSGQHRWDTLQMVTSGDPWSMSQADQDKAAQNPRWTPSVRSPSSASIGAAVSTHAPATAAWIILRCGIWPAAMAIWSDGPLGGQALGEYIAFDDLRWVDGKLTAKGMTPLTLEELAARAHKDGLVTAAMAHGFNRWSWSRATFTVADDSFEVPIDGLAVRHGDGDWTLLDRKNAVFPVAGTERAGVARSTGCGAVVALGVERASGKVKVEAVHQVLECGRMLVPDIVSGVTQGGIAMGLGHALSENLPLYDDGPGNGTWNLNRYQIATATDVPVWKTTIEILPPLGETDAPKGMAEVVIIPVVAGSLNAIRDAVGARVTSLPATPEKIMKAL